jgi:proline dehydrogenase
MLVLVGISGGATIEDLVNDLERIPENTTIDEIIFIVGCAWNYNVSENGIVTLEDGHYDLT